MKKIAVATDFSDVSINAIRYAAKLSKEFSAELSVIHVYETPVFFTSEMPYTAVEAAEKVAKTESESKMEQLMKQLYAEFPDLSIKQVVKRGLTADLVTEISGNSGAEMLVVGATGAGMVERALIGSTTTAVINNCGIPVLVIPGNAQYNGISKIVYTTDLKEENINEVNKIIPIVKQMNAEICFLFVDNTIHADSEKFSEMMSEKIHELVKYEKISGYICTDPNVMNGISLFLHEQKAEMICMLTHKRKFPAMLWDHSITKKFSYHPDVPLLVLHTSSP